MRIALISDIHLSVGSLPLPQPDADVLVIAGDVARPSQAMEWARSTRLPTLYVVGNHEFYGSDLATTYARFSALAEGTNVRILERSEWYHDGVRFLGCTLWSDYRLFDSAESRRQGIDDAVRLMFDFSRIRVAPDFEETFSPAVSQLLFSQSVAWLDECFARSHPGPTVVVTHFAPTPASIAPRFEKSTINASFVSDLSGKIRQWQPELWLHGHTHDSFDYRIGRTRVLCNARGYAKGDATENARFDPAFVVELAV